MENFALQLKITLKDSKPLVWRRIVINTDAPLADLHEAIQIVMPWSDYHMHQFRTAHQSYVPSLDEYEDEDENDAIEYTDMTVRDLLSNVGDKIRYEYDFGDGWEHNIVVEKILPVAEQAIQYITGKNACPPEDCGGIWGYQHLLEVLSNPKDPEYKEMRKWLGLSKNDLFDPTSIGSTPEELNDLLSDF